MSICNEWSILYHPIFYEQYQNQIDKVKKLKAKVEKGKLTLENYKKHPDVKLLANLRECIREKIVQNPLDSRYRLTPPLQNYCRVKGLGLPSRYRLFFWVDQRNCNIILLWLGYPREEGSKKDCYEVFKKKVAKGEFLTDSEDLRSL